MQQCGTMQFKQSLERQRSAQQRLKCVYIGAKKEEI
jgi:hypothetical protein